MIRKMGTIFSMLLLLGVEIAQAETSWTFHLDGTQAAGGAGTGSEATGTFVFVFHDETSTINIYGEHNVANVTAAHIHAGARGEEGGVVLGFASPSSPINAEWQITEAQLAVLNAGNYYVNVHSQAFPSGEIRGQVEKTASDLYDAITFSVYVQPWQSGIEGITAGIPLGMYTVMLGMGRDVITVEWNQFVQGATAAHIHRGAVGENGPVVFGLSAEAEGSKTWFPTPDDVSDLVAGRLYVNVHTEAFPGGFARGQIIQNFYDYAPNNMLDFDLTGAQANGGQGTGSEATGRIVCFVNEMGNTMTIYGTHNVEGATAAHVHRGAPNENGPVVFGFTSGTSPINTRWIMSSRDIDDLEAGNLYINVHSAAFPGGEIRGKLENVHGGEENDAFSVEVELSGAQENAGQGVQTFASGLGILVVRNDDYPFVYFAGSHTAAFPTASHIHRGHADENGGVMFALNLNLTSIDGMMFPGEGVVDDFLHENTYVNVHTTTFPAGEVRGNIVIDENGVGESVDTPLPAKYDLSASYPNPFNSSARLVAQLPSSGRVELSIFDLAGREVARLVDGELSAGAHEFVWEAGALSAGTYIAKMNAGGVTNTTKLVLVR